MNRHTRRARSYSMRLGGEGLLPRPRRGSRGERFVLARDFDAGEIDDHAVSFLPGIGTTLPAMFGPGFAGSIGFAPPGIGMAPVAIAAVACAAPPAVRSSST